MKINLDKIEKKYHRSKKPKLRPELLLMPNIPKPLHGLNPRSIKGKEWWDKQRNEVYAKQGFYCIACGIYKFKADYHKWLEAHEVYEYDYSKGEAKFVEIVALCHSCHNYIHDGRMKHMVEKRRMPVGKQKKIIKHGNAVLNKAGLSSDTIPEIQNIANWEDWYLLFEGKKYKGKFASYAHWTNYYKKVR